MPAFHVLVNGRNLLAEIDGVPKKLGFYTNRDVEAADQSQAMAAAMQLVQASVARLGALVHNTSDDPLQVFPVEVTAIDRIDGSKPVAGFAFYDDAGDAGPADQAP